MNPAPPAVPRTDPAGPRGRRGQGIPNPAALPGGSQNYNRPLYDPASGRAPRANEHLAPLDVVLEITVPKAGEMGTDGTITIGWECRNGPVTGLEIHLVEQASMTNAQKHLTYALCARTDAAPLKGEKSIPVFKDATFFLSGYAGRDLIISPPVEFSVPRLGRLHPQGASIKTKLGDKTVVPKKKEIKAEESALKAQFKKLMVEIAKQVLPEKDVSAGSQMPAEDDASVAEDVEFAVKHALDEIGADAVVDTLSAIPGIGIAMAAGGAGVKLVKAAKGGYQSWQLFKGEKLVVRYQLYPQRPQTPASLFDRLGVAYKTNAYKNLARAAYEATKAVVKVFPGTAVGVSIADKSCKLIAGCLFIYRSRREAKLTNWMLVQCRKYQDPDDYYHTIRTGHVALACFLVDAYTLDELDRLDKEPGTLQQVRKDIQARLVYLKDRAKDLQKTLLFEMASPSVEPPPPEQAR